MPIYARRTGNALSSGAKIRLANIKPYPALYVWLNPLTRGIAQRIANENWVRTLEEIDFSYRMQDITISGVPCVKYETEATSKNKKRILYIHGGAFVAGSPRVNASTVLPICHLTGLEGIGVDYTLLPEGRFPTAIDEVDRVYRSLITDELGDDFVIVADSAGGTIALSCLMRWRDDGVKLPCAAVFLSPVVDGNGASDTQITVDGHDPLISSNGGKNIRRLFEYYAPGMNTKDPRISPIYGEFSDLPPLLVHVGSREVQLGDAARLAETARRAGTESHLRVFDGMFHLFHMHWKMDEAKAAHEDIGAFIASH